VVLFLARLVPSKRPQDALAAFARLRIPEAMLLFVGEGPLRPRLEATARRLGVADRVRFLGAVPHDRVPEVMGACDLFVSTSSLTNMALPTCEAMLCGVPVVAYATGETARVVKNGETGRLVEEGDVDALADAMEELLANEAELRRLGESARRFARRHFTDWSDRMDREMEILESIMETGRRSAVR
jgi:glycosyltransferase involved in cell wall biosynthesis